MREGENKSRIVADSIEGLITRVQVLAKHGETKFKQTSIVLNDERRGIIDLLCCRAWRAALTQRSQAQWRTGLQRSMMRRTKFLSGINLLNR